MSKRKIFNDPVHGFITIPQEIIYDIIAHPYFQRLRRIKQLGLTDYVYPGALHTRFHHALGAFHLMRKAIYMLKDKGQVISEEEEIGALIAILLHDIGHGPYSHTLEHSLISGVSHEDLSLLFMEKLNASFNGQLDLAIKIFKDEHANPYLHQLVSGQLDVDRLDYLTRDSFFTGVNEGVISYDRIIEMLQVKNGSLVVEAKGIYSIEKFLIARRLMYWQVYLHKTVVCVEEMLIKIIERARGLIARGMEVDCTPVLRYFLKNEVKLPDFSQDEEVLKTFDQLDDYDVFAGIKTWINSNDKVLSFLSASIIDRKLFKIEMTDEPVNEERMDAIKKKAMVKHEVDEVEVNYLVFEGSTSNRAYDASDSHINILFKDGSIRDIADASDHYNIGVLSKVVVKYYLIYPKDIQV